MIVVGIMSILVLLAIPQMSRAIVAMRLASATNAVKYQVMLARVRALANPSVHCGVWFDVPNSRTLIFFDSETSGTKYQYDSGTDKLYQTNSSPYALPKGVTLRLPSTEPIVNSCVVFRGDGSAKIGGGIEVVAGTSVRLVNVLASTGR